LKGVFAVAAGLRSPIVAGADVSNDDSGASYRSLLIIHDRTANRSGGYLSLQRAGTGECDKKSTAKHEGRAEIEIDAGEERRLILHSFTHLEELVPLSKAQRQPRTAMRFVL
jgi:hypothetical protein